LTQSRQNDSQTDTTNAAQERFRRARVLVVEDQDDVRRLLVTALEIEGHQVDEARNAIEGLQKIRQARYDLVLTDYAMPGGTGTWMLQQASADGLLRQTVSLVVTAHPDARELCTHDVIPKPLDLDNFLDQVRRVLASRRRPDTAGTADDSSTRHRSRFIVELVLYVSSASPASIQARHNLEQVLDGFERSQIKYTICDLGRDPMAGEIDRVAFTPTLVKRYPEPRMWLLGNLRDTALIADLLRVCGVDAKA
jgi:two-component system response regulator GlrR